MERSPEPVKLELDAGKKAKFKTYSFLQQELPSAFCFAGGR
jgi:hypothetical protein